MKRERERDRARGKIYDARTACAAGKCVPGCLSVAVLEIWFLNFVDI